jgi:hypothetical protein
MDIKCGYEAKLDSKKRITIRNAASSYFKVLELEDGNILLKPLILVDPDSISKKTLVMLNKAAKNFKNGKSSKKIDLDKYNFED